MALAPSPTAPAAPTEVVIPKGMIPARPNPIPPSVQAVIDRGDQLHAEHIARLNGEPAPGEVVPPVEPPAPDPNAPPVVAAPPAPETPPVEPAADNWEQRFKSLEGRFNSQFPKMREQNELLAAEVRRLVQENTQLRAAPPAATAAPSAAPVSLGLTQEEVDSFGPDLVDVIQRVVRAETQKFTADVTSQVTRVEQNADAARLQSLIDFMVSKIPNFVELNNDPALLNWLALPDLMSGVTRQELLTSAWNSRDGNRALAIFNSYFAESGTAPRPAGSQALPVAPAAPAAPAVPPPSNRIPLVSLAAPGRGSSSAPTNGAGTQQPTFTKAQITQFYREITMPNMGPWRGKLADKDAMERAIFQAQLEGRVVD